MTLVHECAPPIHAFAEKERVDICTRPCNAQTRIKHKLGASATRARNRCRQCNCVVDRPLRSQQCLDKNHPFCVTGLTIGRGSIDRLLAPHHHARTAHGQAESERPGHAIILNRQRLGVLRSHAERFARGDKCSARIGHLVADNKCDVGNRRGLRDLPSRLRRKSNLNGHVIAGHGGSSAADPT